MPLCTYGGALGLMLFMKKQMEFISRESVKIREGQVSTIDKNVDHRNWLERKNKQLCNVEITSSFF
jgi:hypothetical protein